MMGDWIKFFNTLKDALAGTVSNLTLIHLLNLMSIGIALPNFGLTKGYAKNVEGFTGIYTFTSRDGLLKTSAIFGDGRMEVKDEILPNWNVQVVFKDDNAFWKFLFAKDNDVLDSILTNDVEVEGNLNYLYKFGFMAKDLMQRVGLM